MISQTLDDIDPIKNTTILNAIRWLIDAWRNDVSIETITNCWRHSQLFGPCYGPEPRPPDFSEEAHLQRLAEELLAAGKIKTVMDMANFINPPEEAVEDSGDDLIEHIAETFSEAREPEEEDGEQQLPQPITTTAALQAVNLLVQFEVQEGGLDLPALERIRQRITEVQLERAGSGKQTTINSYFQTVL